MPNPLGNGERQFSAHAGVKDDRTQANSSYTEPPIIANPMLSTPMNRPWFIGDIFVEAAPLARLEVVEPWFSEPPRNRSGDFSERLEEPALIEAVDPFKRGKLHLVDYWAMASSGGSPPP